MTPTIRIILPVLVVLFSFTPVASAQNLLTNASFDVDVMGWDAPVTLEHDPDGFVAAGSAQTTGLSPFSGIPETAIFQCVNLDGATASSRLDVLGAIKTVNYTAISINVLLFFFGGADCTDAQLETVFLPVFDIGGPDEWNVIDTVLVPASIPDTAMSARFIPLVTAEASADPDTARTRFDDLFFGFAPFFADGFESGNTSNWGATQ